MKKKSKAKKGAAASKKTRKTGVQPAGDRVLIRRIELTEVTSFGIIIPDSSKEKSEEGVIVAVGPGRLTSEGKRIPVSFTVGQKVRFTYGDEMKIEGVEHVLVHEDNIVAILN